MPAATTDLTRALGRIPSGLFIVTLTTPTGDAAMLASWVQQCSFEPPQLSLALKAGRGLLDVLTPGTPFAINILGEGQSDLLKHFGKGFEPGQPPFEGLAIERSEPAAPVLSAALAHLHCHVAAQFPAGDHHLVIGRVVAGRVHTDGRPATHVRRDGSHY